MSEYNQSVKQLSDAVYRYAVRYTQNAAVAEDVVQDTFLCLWNHREQVAFDGVRPYLFSLAHNRLVDLYRREQAASRYGEEAVFPPEPSVLARMETRDALSKVLASLPEVQRSVLLLRDDEGFSYKDIASVLQLSEQQVQVYLFRARVAARKGLEAEGYRFRASNRYKKRNQQKKDDHE